MGRPEGIIIGGGAAGLMAAITAAENGAGVTILEHMPRVGKKIQLCWSIKTGWERRSFPQETESAI